MKHPKAQNPLINNLEEDSSIESGCGGDLTEAEEETLKWDSGEQTRETLVMGSFSTCGHFFTLLFTRGNDKPFRWKSLFFYRCTDEVLFAPLRSQGVDSRLNYIRANTAAGAPPPCSPKSMYVLANQAGQTSNGSLKSGADTSSFS